VSPVEEIAQQELAQEPVPGAGLKANISQLSPSFDNHFYRIQTCARTASRLNRAQARSLTLPSSGKTCAPKNVSKVHRGIKPWRLLLTSFTNEACDELRDRVGAMMPQCRRVNILTVHSLALSIVQAFHVKAGYPRPVQVLDKAPLHQLKEWWQWALLEKYRIKACGWLSVAESTGWEDLRLKAEAADPALRDQLMNFPAPSMAREPPLVRTLHGDAQAGGNGKRPHAWRYAIARALLYHLRRVHEPDVHKYLCEKHGELKIPDVLFRPPGGTLPGIRHAMATAKREKEKPEMFLAGRSTPSCDLVDLSRNQVRLEAKPFANVRRSYIGSRTWGQIRGPTVGMDFPRWQSISQNCKHFPWWETTSHSGQLFSTLGFPACPASRHPFLGYPWRGVAFGWRPPPLWMCVRRRGKQEIPRWKMISHRGKLLPIVGNHFPPFALVFDSIF
jgi:hypothetical protein